MELRSILLPNLDPNRYGRQEIFPYPEIDNPPKVWNYSDNLSGIIIRSQSNRAGEGDEVVVIITYRPAGKDENLRCPNTAKAPGKKP